MALRFWIRLAEIALVLLLAGAVILSWREARSDRAELQSQLAAANQSLSAATDRQHDRDAKLNEVLSGIAAQKKAAATPDQLLAGIAREVGLPTPLLLQAAAPSPEQSTAPGGAKSAGKSEAPGSLQDSAATNSSASGTPFAAAHSVGAANAANTTTTPSSGSTPVAAGSTDPRPPSAPEAKIPASDLRPLYDYVLDCKSCQAKLTASQADLADEKSKTAALTKSRDDAVRAAKGGSIWKRAARAAKWFAIGAAAGAIAAKTVR